MIFGFSLYTVPLQVILVIYFERGLRGLRELEILEDDEIYCHQLLDIVHTSLSEIWKRYLGYAELCELCYLRMQKMEQNNLWL